MYKTPRTDEADKFVTKVHKLDGKAYDTEWVYASFAQDLEIELNKWEEDALRYCKNADFWRDKYEKLEEQRDEAIRLATLFQTLYLRLGEAEDEHYNTLMVQGAAKSLAELKGLKFFGEEEA